MPARSAKGISGRANGDLMHFGLTSYAESGSLWSHQLATGGDDLIRPSSAALDPADYVVEQVKVTSADGTPITMFLAHKKGLKRGGHNPTLLYGYGGFDVSLTPSFGASRFLFLEKGGLLAVPNLRGGGEYGEDVARGRELGKKQNVFDDFAGCARWLAPQAGLVRRGSPINGRSNGGLLVGACY